MSGLASAPAVVQAWIAQLLAPEFLAILGSLDLEGQRGQAHQVDVRLSSAGGKVRARPAIVLDGGQQAMIASTDMLIALRSTD